MSLAFEEKFGEDSNKHYKICLLHLNNSENVKDIFTKKTSLNYFITPLSF